MSEVNLGRFSVAYPVFPITATYRYRKVGTPTVFDELLMGLAAEFPQLKNNSLRQIMDLLQLDEAFIRQALQNLRETGLLEHRYFDEELSHIPLSELVLTENGKKFYREKKMPGKRRTESNAFLFNPISHAVEKSVKSTENIDVWLNKTLFPIDDTRLNTISLEAIADFDWVTPDVSLEENGISHSIDEADYQAVNIRLNWDQNRNLYLECDDKVFSPWLSALTSDRVREDILEPLFEDIIELERIAEAEINIDLLKHRIDLGLATMPSDYSVVKNAVAVKFSNQKVDESRPYIVFSRIQDEAVLQEQVLFVPYHVDLPITATKLFFDFNSHTVWLEQCGLVNAYFAHQPIKIPVRMMSREESGWIQDLPVFQKPNEDTLIFMANFVPEHRIVEKLPEMSILQAVEFSEKIAKVWKGKKFAPFIWAEKISLLDSKAEIESFKKLFSNVTLTLTKCNTSLQKELLNTALQDPKSDAVKMAEFSDLLKAKSAIDGLNAEKMTLKTVSAESLNVIGQWENTVAEFESAYPAIQSEVLAKISQNLTAWKMKISGLFAPQKESTKYAVLDTDFIRKHPKEIVGIQQERTVIFSQTVLDELDYQKEQSKKAVIEAQELLNSIQTETALQKVGEITAEIKLLNEEIERLEAETQSKQAQLKSLMQEAKNGKEK